MNNEIKLTNAAEVAKRLGVGRSTVYLRAKKGEIPSIRIGQRYVFSEAWLQEIERKAAGE